MSKHSKQQARRKICKQTNPLDQSHIPIHMLAYQHHISHRTMSRRLTTRAMKAAATAAATATATATVPSTTTSNNNATKDQAGPATGTKRNNGNNKKRQTMHAAVAVADPRAPKNVRNGYELFLLAGGVDLQAGNIKTMDLTAFKRLNEEWQQMTEGDRAKWSGQGVLDRIRFAAEMEMYHGSGTVQVIKSKDFSLQLTPQDAKEMKEREDKARHIAAHTFLEIMKHKKRKTITSSAVMVSPVMATLPPADSSTADTSDIATIATPIASNTSSGGSNSFDGTTAPALVELSSVSSFSDDPDEVIV